MVLLYGIMFLGITAGIIGCLVMLAKENDDEFSVENENHFRQL